MADPTRPPLPPLPEPSPPNVWHDYTIGRGMEPLPPNRGVLVLDHLDTDREMTEIKHSTTVLTVDTWAQIVHVSPFVTEDEPMLRATIGDLLYMLAESLREQGKHYVGDRPVVTLHEDYPIPYEVPSPWWRKPLVWLGFVRPILRYPPPLHVLRAEVRAA